MKLRNQYFILRHGQTIYQTKKKEWTYPEINRPKIRLTKKGKNQIKSTLKNFGGRKIDLIFSSDFSRARETAKIAAKKFGIKKINFSKKLRDINMGIYHGRKKEEYYHDFPSKSKKRFLKSPPEGESWVECQKRILNFLKEIDKKYKRKTILLVSHGDPLWLLEGGIKNLSQDKLLKEKEANYIKVGELRQLPF